MKQTKEKRHMSNDYIDRIEKLKAKIRFYEEQIAEDEGDGFEEYEIELVAAIDELNRLTEKLDKES